MSAFKDMVARDNRNVFLNLDEYAELRTIIYDGKQYEDIPLVTIGPEQKDREKMKDDHIEGLFLMTTTIFCAIDDLDGNVPENGMRFKVNDEEGGGGFFHEYYVRASNCEMGMLQIELEAIDE